MEITYKRDVENVDWNAMKRTLVEDNFDNGRSPEQLQESFSKSRHTCIAYAENKIVGTARALSDDVCNGYIVDVWTLSAYRRQGIARTMMRQLLADMPGQHIYLFTDDSPGFYHKLGFQERPIGLETVVGRWLVNTHE